MEVDCLLSFVDRSEWPRPLSRFKSESVLRSYRNGGRSSANKGAATNIHGEVEGKESRGLPTHALLALWDRFKALWVHKVRHGVCNHRWVERRVSDDGMALLQTVAAPPIAGSSMGWDSARPEVVSVKSGLSFMAGISVGAQRSIRVKKR